MAVKNSSGVSFRTQYQSHERVFAEEGSRFHTLYSSRVDADGSIVLEESGSENLYEYIQSHKDSCDINVLLARYNNGEPSVLSQRQGMYGDFTQLPQTFAETLNFMIQGQEYFESLPLEIREKFGHSFERFVASMDDLENFSKIMSSVDSGSTLSDSKQSVDSGSSSTSADSSSDS